MKKCANYKLTLRLEKTRLNTYSFLRVTHDEPSYDQNDMGITWMKQLTARFATAKKEPFTVPQKAATIRVSSKRGYKTLSFFTRLT